MAESPLHVSEMIEVFREVAEEDPSMRGPVDQIRSEVTEWMATAGVEPSGEAIEGALCALTYLPQRLRQTEKPLAEVLPKACAALADAYVEGDVPPIPEPRQREETTSEDPDRLGEASRL